MSAYRTRRIKIGNRPEQRVFYTVPVCHPTGSLLHLASPGWIFLDKIKWQVAKGKQVPAKLPTGKSLPVSVEKPSGGKRGVFQVHPTPKSSTLRVQDNGVTAPMRQKPRFKEQRVHRSTQLPAVHFRQPFSRETETGAPRVLLTQHREGRAGETVDTSKS